MNNRSSLGDKQKLRRSRRFTGRIQESGADDFDVNKSAWREALYQAWFTTSLEQTKSVFTPGSAAGMALTLTLLFNEKTHPMCSWAPVWLLLAAFFFGCSTLACLWVFRLNGNLVQTLVQYRDAEYEKANRLVWRANLAARLTFGAALVLILFAGISQVWLYSCANE